MDRLMGDERLIETVLNGFLADIPMQIDALGAFLQAGDVEGAERQAHTIKGASANVGAETLRALAREMEIAANAGNLGEVKSRVDEMHREFERFGQAVLTTRSC